MQQSHTALNRLKKVVDRLAAVEVERDRAVAGAMAAGCTWAEIGEALGVSAQAAHKRFRWLRHSEATGETWRESPLAL